MNPPAEAAWRFLPALLLGCGLGLLFGFLRPLKRRFFPDLLFFAATMWAWVLLSFGICLGDLRPVYTLTLLAGIFLWDRSFGRWLNPVFSSFWKGFFLVFAKISFPLKNFSAKCKKIGKNLFASRKKAAIIKWNNRLHLRRITGGNPHGK